MDPQPRAALLPPACPYRVPRVLAHILSAAVSSPGMNQVQKIEGSDSPREVCSMPPPAGLPPPRSTHMWGPLFPLWPWPLALLVAYSVVPLHLGEKGKWLQPCLPPPDTRLWRGSRKGEQQPLADTTHPRKETGASEPHSGLSCWTTTGISLFSPLASGAWLNSTPRLASQCP